MAGFRARHRRAEHPALRRAASHAERRPRGSDARPGGQHARPAGALRQEPRGPRAEGDEGHGRRPFRPRLLRQHARGRSGGAQTQTRVHAARVRRRRVVRRQRGLRIRRPQHQARDGREPRHVRGGVHSAAQGSQGARPLLPRRAMPDAGLERARPLAQQHRLRARSRGSRCIASARSTASATSSASTTTHRTPSSWARTRARCSST